MPHFGSDAVSKTIPEEYQEFAETLTSERGALVAREVFVVVTAFIHWCIDENTCLSSNPIKASLRKYIRVNRDEVLSKKKRKQNEHPLKTRDVKRIFDYIPERREAVVYHSMATTARIGEALGVRVKDINIFKGTLTFSQQIQSYPKDMLKGTRYQDDISIDKNGSARVLDHLKTEESHRTVKLIPETVELFRKAIEGKDPDDLIFTTRNGTPCTPDNFRKRYWKPMLKKLGLEHKTKLTPHVLRTYVFSKGVASGQDSALLSKALGHKEISTTMQNYFTDIEDDNQVNPLEHMSEVVGNAEIIEEIETTDRAFKVVGE